MPVMSLYVLFGYDDVHMQDDLVPEALLVWDEFCIENNPEGYDEAVQKTKDEHKGMSFFEAELVVDTEALRSRMKPLRIKAAVSPKKVE